MTQLSIASLIFFQHHGQLEAFERTKADGLIFRRSQHTAAHCARPWCRVMAFLSFPCLGQEFAYTSSLASRTLHTAALQRILLACLCLLVCGKEAFAAYVYHFSPRCCTLLPEPVA